MNVFFVHFGVIRNAKISHFLGETIFAFKIYLSPTQSFPTTQPASSHFFFLHHAQYVCYMPCMSAFLRFPLFFFGICGGPTTKINTKSGKKNKQKSIQKIQSRPRYRWVKFKLLSSSINISFNCVVTKLSIASSMGERQCTEVPTAQATEVPYLPMENKVGWWVYERPPSGKLTMVIEKRTLLKMYSIFLIFEKCGNFILCYLCDFNCGVCTLINSGERFMWG